MTRRGTQPETPLREAIHHALGRDPDLYVMRNAQVQDGYSHARGGLGPGSPDEVVIIFPWGHCLGIEVKMPGEVMRPNQEECARKWRDRGATVEVAYSVEGALAIVDRTREYLREKCPWVGPTPLRTDWKALNVTQLRGRKQ